MGFFIANLGRLIVYGLGNIKYWLVLMFVTYLPSITIKLLAALGVGYATYSLGDFGLDLIFQKIKTEFDGLPSTAIAALEIARVDEAISIIFGALTARITMRFGLSAIGGGSSVKIPHVFKA